MEYTLIDREHIYGPDHCLTLATRHHLADRAGERREPVRAAAALRQLVPDLVRIQELITLRPCAPRKAWRDGNKREYAGSS